MKPKNEWICVKNTHQPIICMEDFKMYKNCFLQIAEQFKGRKIRIFFRAFCFVAIVWKQ